MTPKPDIVLNKTDTNLVATKRHIGELYQNYSSPLIFFNLTKEHNPRECKLSDEYRYAIEECINPTLPEDKRINYVHFDVKKNKKKLSFF